MNDRKDILEELRSINSPLADMSRSMPYHVPAGYFGQFAGSVHATMIDLSQKEEVPAWSKNMPFHIPAGYFEDLTGKIVAAANNIEITAVMPKEIPFKTPPGYFERLPAQLLIAAKATDIAPKTAKVIPLKKINVYRSIQWAAAAIFIIFIGIGSYITFFSEGTYYPEKVLASVPNTDIHDYLQHTYRMDVDNAVGNDDLKNLQLDNKEIIQYLDETGWDVVD